MNETKLHFADNDPILDKLPKVEPQVTQDVEVVEVKSVKEDKNNELDSAYDVVDLYDSIDGNLLRAESVAAFVINKKDKRLRGGFFARATRALKRGGAFYVKSDLSSDYEEVLGAYLNESKPVGQHSVYRKAD